MKVHTIISRGVSRHAIALAVVLSMAVPGALLARYNPKPGFNLFSREQEVQVGQQAATDVDKKTPLVNDAELNRYVQRLGARLAAKAPGPQYPYTFKIVNQKDINAFALPGGPVYVNLGTIQAADNESELAGVMAHEISHVVMRHATSQASKQMAAQLPLALLGGALGNGVLGQVAKLGIQFGAGSVFLKNSRDAERQADLVGAGIMNDAGYNPKGMVDFFRKLEEQGGAAGPQFLSDHPNPGNRAQTVATEVATLQHGAYQQDSAEWRAAKAKVGGMRALTAQQIQQQQQQGGAQPGSTQPGSTGGMRPSGNYRSLNHSAYSISYPDNWQVFGDENSAVTIAPPGGVSQEAVAYGVIINGFQPQQGSGNTLDDATRQLLDDLHQSNPDLRRVSNVENIRVNGQPAKSVMLVGPSPVAAANGGAQRERDQVIVMQRRDGVVVYLVFIAPERDFGDISPAFEKMLRSIRLK